MARKKKECAYFRRMKVACRTLSVIMYQQSLPLYSLKTYTLWWSLMYESPCSKLHIHCQRGATRIKQRMHRRRYRIRGTLPRPWWSQSHKKDVQTITTDSTAQVEPGNQMDNKSNRKNDIDDSDIGEAVLHVRFLQRDLARSLQRGIPSWNNPCWHELKRLEAGFSELPTL